MKKKLFIFLLIILSAGLIIICRRDGQDKRASDILALVVGTQPPVGTVELFGAEEEGFFGDSSYTWRLNISRLGTGWLIGMKPADESDLLAAVTSIEYLLHLKLPPQSRRAVLRQGFGGWSAYVVTGDDPDHVYLLVYTSTGSDDGVGPN